MLYISYPIALGDTVPEPAVAYFSSLYSIGKVRNIGLAGAFNMVYDSHRKVVVLYGLARGDSVCRTWEYDGERWEEVELEMSPPPRAWSAMAFDEARGVTVLLGGEWDGEDLNDLWEYDGQEWVQR
jgi:hypothetical protein